jgi:quercetin dioxygenase-like cupin family protein
MTATATKPKVILSRASDNKWENKGLRSFLEYRNLGIEEATDGKFGGSIARALTAKKATDHAALHYHTLGFHITMVLRGWMRTYYDGLGEVILKAGDCVTYGGEVVQSHTEHSDDFEVLQITMPGEFPTVQVEDKPK